MQLVYEDPTRRVNVAAPPCAFNAKSIHPHHVGGIKRLTLRSTLGSSLPSLSFRGRAYFALAACTGSCACCINLCRASAARLHPAPPGTGSGDLKGQTKTTDWRPNDAVNGCSFTTRCCNVALGICSHSGRNRTNEDQDRHRVAGPLARSRCLARTKDAEWRYRCGDRAASSTAN